MRFPGKFLLVAVLCFGLYVAFVYLLVAVKGTPSAREMAGPMILRGLVAVLLSYPLAWIVVAVRKRL